MTGAIKKAASVQTTQRTGEYTIAIIVGDEIIETFAYIGRYAAAIATILAERLAKRVAAPTKWRVASAANQNFLLLIALIQLNALRIRIFVDHLHSGMAWRRTAILVLVENVIETKVRSVSVKFCREVYG